MLGQSFVFVIAPLCKLKLLELADWSVIVFPSFKIVNPFVPGVKLGEVFICHSPVVLSVEPNTVGAKEPPSQWWTWEITPLK